MTKLKKNIKVRGPLLLAALAITLLGSQSLQSLLTSPASAQDAPVIQLRISNNILSGEALGEFEADEPETGNILAREHVFYTNNNGQFETGIWEAKSGTMTIQNSPYAEVMYILEGSFAMSAPGNSAITYSAGEGVVMPKGWTGNFTIPEGGVKLIWSNYTNSSLPFPETTDLVLLDRDTLGGRRFADFTPFDPDVSDVIARDHEFYRTSDGKFGVDVWEAQPGQVHFADLGYDEMIYVLEGNMTFVNTDGNAQIYSAGRALVLPRGWSGTGVVSTNGARLMLFWYRNELGN